MKRVTFIAGCLLFATTGVVFVAQAARAPLPPPDLAERVGFDQRIGHAVPQDLDFVDSRGRTVSLADVAGGRPLLLSLGYYRCPNLCGATLHGIAKAVAGMDLEPGRDFEVAFVSIDPREDAKAAADARAMLGKDVPKADVGKWHLLRGDEHAIRTLADAIGFRYFHDRRNDQYAHAAGLVVLTGAGKAAQYFFGVRFAPRPLRLALVGASSGKLGGVIDQLVLFCCGYDPSTGRYSVLIGRVMTMLGCSFALAFAVWLVWLRRRRTA